MGSCDSFRAGSRQTAILRGSGPARRIVANISVDADTKDASEGVVLLPAGCCADFAFERLGAIGDGEVLEGEGNMKRRTLFGLAAVALAEMIGRTPVSAQVTYPEIAAAAAAYGVSYDWLVSTAYCESAGTMDPGITGPRGEQGWFQFYPDTFYRIGGCWGNPYNAYDSAMCAAKMFAEGYCTHWCCSGCYPNPCSG